MSASPVIRKEIIVGGRPMILESGRLARQAGGAAFGTGSAVLVTTICGSNIRTVLTFS